MKKKKLKGHVFIFKKNVLCGDCAKDIIAKLFKQPKERICGQMIRKTGCAVELIYFLKKSRF